MDTRQEIEDFERFSYENLRRIDRQLRQRSFRFSPQTGILKKRKDKRPRPIVLAKVENRIVQRAVLDVLQAMPAVADVLSTPTSLGGVKGRDRAAAFVQLMAARDAGARFFARSDIRDFFGNIPRARVVKYVRERVSDTDFADLFERATETNLENQDELRDDLDLFPDDETGVAQGSALSTFTGNVLLNDFDRTLNGRGIVCLRYIDDFIILGPTATAVQKAFVSAQRKLSDLGLSAYDPWTHGQKAEHGPIDERLSFLGWDLHGDQIQPSRDRRTRFVASVRGIVETILKNMNRAAKSSDGRKYDGPRRVLVQGLATINSVIDGWGRANAYCNNPVVMRALDEQLDLQIDRLLLSAEALMRSRPRVVRRRVLGVCALQDIPPVPSRGRPRRGAPLTTGRSLSDFVCRRLESVSHSPLGRSLAREKCAGALAPPPKRPPDPKRGLTAGKE